jgi:hypothetical protein
MASATALSQDFIQRYNSMKKLENTVPENEDGDAVFEAAVENAMEPLEQLTTAPIKSAEDAKAVIAALYRLSKDSPHGLNGHEIADELIEHVATSNW